MPYKGKYPGVGLGLNIVRELTHSLGGNIELISEEGKGSQFIITLDLELDPAYATSNQ